MKIGKIKPNELRKPNCNLRKENVSPELQKIVFDVVSSPSANNNRLFVNARLSWHIQTSHTRR